MCVSVFRADDSSVAASVNDIRQQAGLAERFAASGSTSKALVAVGDQKMLVPKKAPTMPKPVWHPPWKLFRVWFLGSLSAYHGVVDCSESPNKACFRVRPYICFHKKVFSMWTTFVGRGWWVLHDGTLYDWSKVKRYDVWKWLISKSVSTTGMHEIKRLNSKLWHSKTTSKF